MALISLTYHITVKIEFSSNLKFNYLVGHNWNMVVVVLLAFVNLI